MKNYFFILLLLFPPYLGISQSNTIKDLRYNLEDRSGVAMVHVNGALLKIASALAEYSDEEDDEIEAFSKVARDITSIDIVNIDDERAFDKDKRKALVSDLIREGYEELMKVREKNKNITIYSLSSDDTNNLKDVILISDDRDNYSIISINGTVSMKELSILID